MVNENIDIAKLLGVVAGKHLAAAYKLHLRMLEDGIPQEKYFNLRSQEHSECIEAVILFQASLEAIINEELENDLKLKQVKKENDELHSKFKMLSFKNKWSKAYAALAIDLQESKYLENYLTFYIAFRVPITHAKSRYMDAAKFNFPQVYEGIKNGYLALEIFYKYLNKFQKEHSWKEYLKECELPLLTDLK